MSGDGVIQDKNVTRQQHPIGKLRIVLVGQPTINQWKDTASCTAGAVIAWLMYADEFKASDGVIDPVAQRNIFSTNPTTEGTNYARNFFCEAICTFVFISAILAAASRAGENVLMLAICVGLIVWAVGMGMGGITGFAMNQARDLGPRMAYQVLPIKHKADNNWKYGLLVPGIAPFVGAALAALFVHGFLGMF